MKRVFRARLKVEKKWAYWNEFGELTTKTGKVRRLTLNDSYGRTRYYSHVWEIKHLIELETVGQYVCRDKKQCPIFEGDIIEFLDGNSENEFTSIGEVVFEEGSFGFTNAYSVKWDDLLMSNDMLDCKVIGNAWDNKNLLEQ